MANNQPGSTSSREPTKSMLRRTLFLLAVCGIVAFIVLGARLFKLQVVDHNYYEGLALSQQVRETSSMASRGTIYDTNMMVLAMSSDVETVFISPAEMAKEQRGPHTHRQGPFTDFGRGLRRYT
jgi:stage V sporulation protein D (sporulation-specific penicillin-binding protein)